MNHPALMYVLHLVLIFTNGCRFSNTPPVPTLAPSGTQLVRSKFKVSCYNYKGAASVQPGLDFSRLGSSSYIDSSLDKGMDVKLPPPRPRRIILARHGESEGNVDEIAYTKVPDPHIALTEKGHAKVEACGKRIREQIDKYGVVDCTSICHLTDTHSAKSGFGIREAKNSWSLRRATTLRSLPAFV